uniref:Uncharacterized protein n=1 Tax=Rhizophora mucronata TaxID=61149 RepID=A0A2P2R298_RHIMU
MFILFPLSCQVLSSTYLNFLFVTQSHLMVVIKIWAENHECYFKI